jgi:lambda family phage portal protein
MNKPAALPQNLLDKAIAVFAPRTALRRMQSRAAIALAGGYNGAGYGRPGLAGWSPRASDAETDTNLDLPILRARARDLVRNAPLAAGALNTMVTNVVGTGISLQPQPDAEAIGLSDEEAEDWAETTLNEFKLWAETTACDVTRTQNFYGLQALVFRSALESGDVFTLLPSVKRIGNPYSLALQVVEADRICNPGFVTDTTAIAAGIELDEYGAPIAYHICRRHPGSLVRRSEFKWDRLTAFGNNTGRRNVLHLFDRRRPGQTRGIPILAPVIEPLKQLQRYTDAELQAAVISGMFAVFVKMDPEAFDGMFDQDGKAAYLNSAMGWDGTMNGSSLDGGGKAVNLLPGESVESTNPGRPNALFDPFVQAIVRQVGVALELPFEVLIKHFTASYSAARAALLDAWRLFRGRRDWLATVFCQPVYEAWLTEAIAIGRIQAPGFFADPAIRRAWCAAVWIGDGPGSIDPAKEVVAAEKRIELGISTIAAESILHDGVDWRGKHKQRVIEQNARKEGGLIETPAPAAPAVEPGDPVAPADAEKPGEPDKKPAAENVIHVHNHPAAINITNSQPDVHAHFEATLPTQPAPDVHAHFEAVMPQQAAPVVNVSVEPTPVTLEATVEAHAAPAQIVIQHPTSARQTVERDAENEIVATVTKYEINR